MPIPHHWKNSICLNCGEAGSFTGPCLDMIEFANAVTVEREAMKRAIAMHVSHVATMNARIETDRLAFERDEAKHARLRRWVLNLEDGSAKGYRTDGGDILAGVAQLRKEGAL